MGRGSVAAHAENTILGRTNQVGPKNERVCCTGRDDWWQINGWTAGVEVGVRYRAYKSMYLELTQKNRVRRAESRTGVPGFRRPVHLDE